MQQDNQKWKNMISKQQKLNKDIFTGDIRKRMSPSFI